MKSLRKILKTAACFSLAAVLFSPVALSQDSNDTSTASAPPAKVSGAEWVLRMAEALREKNFQISLVQLHPGADALPYMWRHGVFEDGTTMEQLSVLNGPGKEYIRVNQVVSVFEPEAVPYSFTSRIIEGPFPKELLVAPLNLQSGYDFVAVGRGRVSGRAAQQVRIVSRDNSRYAYQLWIDEMYFVPLKMNMLDQNGQMIKQIQVTQFAVTAMPDEFFKRINHEALPAITSIPARHHQHNWQVNYLPQGMVEVKRNTHRLAVTGQVVEYAMLSDGLVDVSIYVMPQTENSPQNNVLRFESSTLLTRTEGKVQVSVIGEIPPTTANKIATSLSARVE